MNRRIRTCVFPVLFSLPFTAPAAELPKGLTDVCKRAQQSFSKSEKTAKSAPAKKCFEQVQKSWESCKGEGGPESQDTKNQLDVNFDNRGGTTGADQKLAAAFAGNRDREIAKGKACGTQRPSVERACAKINEDLRVEMQNKTKAMNEVEREIAKNDGNRGEYLKQRDQLQAESRELQDQFQDVRATQNQGATAIDEESGCHVAQARIYDDAVDRTKTHLAGISAGEVGEVAANAVKKGAGDASVVKAVTTGPVQDVAQDLGKTKAKELLINAVSTEESIATRAAAKAAALAAPAAEVGTSGVVGTAAGFVASRSIPVLGAFLGMTNDAGTCSELNVDPVAAYNSKCARSTSGAMRTLSHE